MSEAPRFLVVPEKSRKELSILLGLSADQLRKLSGALRSMDYAFHVRPTSELIAKSCGVSNTEAAMIFQATRNIAYQRSRHSLTWEQLLADLVALSPKETADRDNDWRTALEGVLGDSDENLIIEKLESLQHASVPHMVGARTICDVRPVFDRSRSAIDCAMVLTLLELETHSSAQDEYGTTTIQLTVKNIEDLKRCLDEALTKVALLKATLGKQLRIVP